MSHESELKCSALRELIVPYLDRELAVHDARRVSEHVAECPGCRGELELQQRLSAALDDMYAARPQTDAGMASKVRRKLERERRGVRRIVLGVAATVLIAVGSWWLVTLTYESGNGGHGQDPVSEANGDLTAEQELLENLDVLEVLEEEGIDLTPEVVQVLLDEVAEFDDEELDQLFEFVLEEEVLSDQL